MGISALACFAAPGQYRFDTLDRSVDLILKTGAQPIVLDAAAASDDENVRLRPEPPIELKRSGATLRAKLEPYGVRFWSFKPR